jgi:hypothetical protein
MMAMTAAPPTAMPAIAPVPSFDPLLLDEPPVVVGAVPEAAVTTLGIIVVWPGVRVTTETWAVPPELCSVTVDMTVAELPAVITLVVGCWVITTVGPGAVVVPGGGVVTTVGAGLAQAFHCAMLMFTGMLVPAQFVLN